jgi:K+ transporter
MSEARASSPVAADTQAEGKGHGDLFRFLSHNARSATDFFAIPPNRVVQIGMQIEF